MSMDVIFDVKAAEELLKQMDIYCSGIVQETSELLGIMKEGSGWQDKKKNEFQDDVDLLVLDLNNALSLENDYRRLFYQRIKELRGE